MKKIFIIGSSGHAKVIIDIIEKGRRYEIFGLTDPFKSNGEKVFGYKILGGQKDLPRLVDKLQDYGAIIGVGNNWDRYLIYKEIEQLCPNTEFIRAVHPNTIIGKDVKIGAGTVVMPGAVINSGTQIGQFCIVNTSASIDHECTIEDFASVAPGATLGGNVKVGRFSSVSLGAHIIDKISIGKRTVVGAGALVVKNLPDRVVAYGLPARIIRKTNIGK